MARFNSEILKNKRGSILDMLYILITLVVFAMVIVMVFKFGTQINTQLQQADIGQHSKDISQELIVERMPVLFNYGFMIAFIFLWLGALISAYMSDISPAFLFIGFILIILFVIIAGNMANVYSEFASMSGVQAEAEKFTAITWVFQNYIILSIIMGISMLGVTYAKLRMA